MITKAVKANSAEYYELSEMDDMEPQLDLDETSSSDGHVDLSNYLHVHDYLDSIRDLENDFRLKELETERRLQEINGNDKMMLKAELHKIAGGNEREYATTKCYR